MEKTESIGNPHSRTSHHIEALQARYHVGSVCPAGKNREQKTAPSEGTQQDVDATYSVIVFPTGEQTRRRKARANRGDIYRLFILLMLIFPSHANAPRLSSLRKNPQMPLVCT